MKIRKLELQHIGVFEDETISFKEKKGTGAEIHILTGQNGTGKTTILQALADIMFQISPFKEFAEKKIISAIESKNFFKRFQHENCGGNHGGVIFDNGEKLSWVGIRDGKVYIEGGAYDEEFSNRIKRQNEERDLASKKYKREYIYNFSAFAYSGYRFVEHKENIYIKENPEYNPLENVLEFNKDYSENDYTLNQWLANKMAERNSAFFKGKEEEAKLHDKNIVFLRSIIKDIIDEEIDFDYQRNKVFAIQNSKELDFDLLPDGLRSIISWLGDLIMRMDALKWENDLPIFEREFILFLDEIEVHLHPYWQRKILPVIQKKFINAQIFITTHSPFIVNSVDGAWIYELKLDDNGNCKVAEITESDTAKPIDEILNEIYDIEPTQMYGINIEKEVENFQTEITKAYKKEANFNKKTFLANAKKLALKSTDLKNNVQFELRQLSESLAEEFSI